MAAAYLQRMGERMRTRREELGLSRSDVARQLPGKTNENAIYRWEKGQHRPSDDTLEALAKVLDTTVAYFLSDEPVKDATPDPFARQSQLDRIEDALKAQAEAIEAIRLLLVGLAGDPEEQQTQPQSTPARRQQAS